MLVSILSQVFINIYGDNCHYNIYLFLDESGNSDSNSKWIKPSQRKRSRPLPLPCSTSPSGSVDMADLLQVVADCSSHPDSWPFLKPVTRAEVK